MPYKLGKFSNRDVIFDSQAYYIELENATFHLLVVYNHLQQYELTYLFPERV